MHWNQNHLVDRIGKNEDSKEYCVINTIKIQVKAGILIINNFQINKSTLNKINKI